MGDVIDILCVLKVFPSVVGTSTFVPSEEKVYVRAVCGRVCVRTHLVWKPSLTHWHSGFLDLYLWHVNICESIVCHWIWQAFCLGNFETQTLGQKKKKKD